MTGRIRLLWMLILALTCVMACEVAPLEAQPPSGDPETPETSPYQTTRTAPSMTIQSFHLTSFQRESSRDSNSQLTHYEFADGVLKYCEEWRGYHPSGGGGRTPAIHSRPNAEQLAELEAFLTDNDLLRSQTDADASPPKEGLGNARPGGGLSGGGLSPSTPSPAAPPSAPPPSSRASRGQGPPGMRRDSRSYGTILELNYKGQELKLESAYSTSGPRVESMETRHLSVKLQALQSHLRDLSRKAEPIELSQEERAAESFFNRDGYYPDQVPERISRLTFGIKFVETGKYTTLTEKPFYLDYGGGAGFFVVRQFKVEGKWTAERTSYNGKPEFFKTLAELAVRFKLDKKPESTWYPPGDLPSPKSHVVVTYEVSFAQIHQWGHKTEFSFGDSPELRAVALRAR